MEALVDQIMDEGDFKNKFTSGETSSVTSTEDESILSLIDYISSRQGNLLELIAVLEKYHCEGNKDQRCKAINIIGTVIFEVANLGLDSKATVALCTFFIAKLKDVH